MKSYNILAINPGSTSTKLAVFANEASIYETVMRHTREELADVITMDDALSFRKKVILDALNKGGVDISTLDAVIGRGGLMRPLEGGTYAVNSAMLDDLSSCKYGTHASNLGGRLAYEIASSLGKPSFIADPVVVDELDDLARFSGYPGIERTSIFHALNQKAVAKRFAHTSGKKYQDLNIIVAHLGGGISVGSHKKGRIVDVNNALGGDGPFTAERSGGLPTSSLVEFCFSGKFASAGEVLNELITHAGLFGYLGTNDGREVDKMIEAGDAYAELVYKAMAYQIAKEIGSAAAVLCGDVDAIILTGGLAYDGMLMDWIRERVEFIAKVTIMPGEDELSALNEAASRVLSGEEAAKEY
ncbi:MAG: butyrate kinase [Clostridia bacterium]